jgi:hypothetical protein
MLKADIEEANEAREEQDALDQSVDRDDGIDATIIEAPGIVRDKFSNKTWTLPTDSLQDSGLAVYESPRQFKKDPNFHYQFVRYTGEYPELDEYMSRDYVPVTRAEIGLKEYTSPGQPNPLDSYYTIDGKDICIKIPRQLADIEYHKTYFTTDKKGNIISNHPNVDLGDEPVSRKLDTRTNRHEPTRDELG